MTLNLIGQHCKTVFLLFLVCFLVTPQKCGDRRLNGREICDNGLTAQNGIDGCFNNCTVHPRFRCTRNRNVASFCYPICGDGVVISNEKAKGFCDDGNRKNGDCCTDWCKIKKNWTCSGAPSKCRKAVPPKPPKPSGPVCGNGKIQTGQTCDDGNSVPVDDCSASCFVEYEFTCVGEPSSNCYIAQCLSLLSTDFDDVKSIYTSDYKKYLGVTSGAVNVFSAPQLQAAWSVKTVASEPQFITLKNENSGQYLSHNLTTNQTLLSTANSYAKQWCNHEQIIFKFIRNRKTGQYLTVSHNTRLFEMSPPPSYENKEFDIV